MITEEIKAKELVYSIAHDLDEIAIGLHEEKLICSFERQDSYARQIKTIAKTLRLALVCLREKRDTEI
tara:strand:- start:189 stop:392 length:204 start_codon:yes stop_codon:yes gene_type:complete